MQLSYPGFFVLDFCSMFPASKLEGREAFILVIIEIIDCVFYISCIFSSMKWVSFLSFVS